NCQDMLISDYLPIKALLEHFEQLNLRGGVIRIDGQLAAFSIASEPINQTGIIHVEKAKAEYPGLYTAINKFTLDQILPDIEWVNREEDLGIPGLRKAKMSYYPSRLIHKYEVIITHADT
ncbi:MAG: phosphatidylglycerol lysyltransferase domain-containing protein, partial [Eubacteriales bacterium]|nr:phosphatidylglycerol lysyltransferase domain-containing protein [Eubacteriales bacterium]